MSLLEVGAYVAAVERDGFALTPYRVDDETLATLDAILADCASTPANGRRRCRADGESALFAIRNVLTAAPRLRVFTESACLRAGVTPILGDAARVTRGVFFDKIPGANWKVPWHQDARIAVHVPNALCGAAEDAGAWPPSEHQNPALAEFLQWRRKPDAFYAQPPAAILHGMLTLRLHLDDADENNGALRVIPGSHQRGILNETQIRAHISETPAIVCAARRGEILAMRPLLLHASAAATTPAHRRVLHLEFSADDLPGGLLWPESPRP